WPHPQISRSPDAYGPSCREGARAGVPADVRAHCCDMGIGGRVKLPEDVVIPEDKLVRYLLFPREENGISQFLGLAGWAILLGAWEELARDLHDLAKTYEISDRTISSYGIKWEVQGSLTGPNGQVLYVVTVWITLETSGEPRFVTLFPDKERHG